MTGGRNGPTEGGMGAQSGSAIPESERHARACALKPGEEQSREALLSCLGDPSWRVRKAALAKIEAYREDSALVFKLIAGLASEDNAGFRASCAEALARLGGEVVEELTAALTTSDSDQRKFVVEALGAVGTPTARKALVGMLDDPDVNVSTSVIAALGAMGGEGVIDALRAKLANNVEDLQMAAYLLDALGQLRAKLSPAELGPWLRQPGLQRCVHGLLGFSNDPEAVPWLIDALSSQGRVTRKTASQALTWLVSSLGGNGPDRVAAILRARPDVVEVLVAQLVEEDDEAVAAAATVLGYLDDPGLAAPILEACACRAVVQAGIQAVVGMGLKVVEPLLARSFEVDEESRVLFLDVVELLGDDSAVPELLRIVATSDLRSTEAAVRTLGRVGGEDVVGPLMELLQRDEAHLGRHVALALTSVGRRVPDAVGGTLRGLIEKGDVRAPYFVVLGALGRDDDLDLIQGAMHHSDPEVRCAAIDSAACFGSRFDETAFIYALADENGCVRAAATRALGAYRSEAALEALLTALRDPDPWVVAAAVSSMAEFDSERATAPLLAAAVSSNSLIAIAALEGLTRRKPAGMEAAVRKALAHVDPEVVREAMAAAMALPVKTAQQILIDCLDHRSWHVRRAAAETLAVQGMKVSSAIVEERLAREREPMVAGALESLLERIGTGR